jgi:hypothetical protein
MDFGNLADKPVYPRSANSGLCLNFNSAVLPTVLNIFRRVERGELEHVMEQ